MGKSKQYSAAEKLEILLEVTDGKQSIPEIAVKFQIHPQTIRRWIYRLPEQTLKTLTDKAKDELDKEKKQVASLEQRNVQLEEAVECLKKTIQQLENSSRQNHRDD